MLNVTPLQKNIYLALDSSSLYYQMSTKNGGSSLQMLSFCCSSYLYNVYFYFKLDFFQSDFLTCFHPF